MDFLRVLSRTRDYCSGGALVCLRVSKRNERNCESDSLNEEELLKDFF